MLIEIFRQGADAPEIFDVLVSEEGQMSYVTDRLRKAHLRIVVHTPQKHINTNAASGLFRIIHSYGECTVRFIGFE
jgi:hypothetical protein